MVSLLKYVRSSGSERWAADSSQYTGLEKLHKDFGPRGLVVLGFPSNEFGHQEPGSDEQIAEFCQLNHGVSFPLMKKARQLTHAVV